MSAAPPDARGRGGLLPLDLVGADARGGLGGEPARPRGHRRDGPGAGRERPQIEGKRAGDEGPAHRARSAARELLGPSLPASSRPLGIPQQAPSAARAELDSAWIVRAAQDAEAAVDTRLDQVDVQAGELACAAVLELDPHPLAFLDRDSWVELLRDASSGPRGPHTPAWGPGGGPRTRPFEADTACVCVEAFEHLGWVANMQELACAGADRRALPRPMYV